MNQEDNTNIEVFKEILKNIDLYFHETNELLVKHSRNAVEKVGTYYSSYLGELLGWNDAGFRLYKMYRNIHNNINATRCILEFRTVSIEQTKDSSHHINFNFINNGGSPVKGLEGSFILTNNTNTWGVQQKGATRCTPLEIPCTEEEYFMYSLKEEIILEYTDYHEFEELRKRVYKDGYDKKILVFLYEDIDLEEIQEIHEYLKTGYCNE